MLKENWKTTLNSALKRYRAATHPFTGHSPNELMNLKDKVELPSLFEPESFQNETANEVDRKMKIKNKIRADKLKHDAHVEFNKGNKVLHKWEKKNKFQIKFDPNQYSVTDVNGTMITVSRPN